MALSDEIKKLMQEYLKDMTEEETALALKALKQEQKRRKRKKKKTKK